MSKFLRNIIVYGCIMAVMLEVICRLGVDPFYYKAMDMYPPGRNNFLFVGSSRVPASIDESVFERNNLKCQVAGRGYTTGGIHLTALRYKLARDPRFLSETFVLVEYPDALVFEENADKYQYEVYEPKTSRYDRAMPHVILPYLTFKTMIEFIKLSPNSLNVKVKLALLYCSSAYRCILFLQEKQPVQRALTLIAPSRNASKSVLATEGGIKNQNFARAKRKAVELALLDSIELASGHLITEAELNSSILSEMNNLVRANGGRLLLFRVPLHSVQKNISASARASENKRIFELWLEKTGIEVLDTKHFQYSNDDFPDTWHLSVNRRSEFSSLLMDELISRKIVPASSTGAQYSNR
jgi:hypothetical protein